MITQWANFWGVSCFQNSRPLNAGAGNLNFLKLLKTMVPYGYPVHTFIFMKKTEIWPLTQGVKMCTARKKDPNLTITLPNLNIFQ